MIRHRRPPIHHGAKDIRQEGFWWVAERHVVLPPDRWRSTKLFFPSIAASPRGEIKTVVGTASEECIGIDLAVRVLGASFAACCDLHNVASLLGDNEG